MSVVIVFTKIFANHHQHHHIVSVVLFQRGLVFKMEKNTISFQILLFFLPHPNRQHYYWMSRPHHHHHHHHINSKRYMPNIQYTHTHWHKHSERFKKKERVFKRVFLCICFVLLVRSMIQWVNPSVHLFIYLFVSCLVNSNECKKTNRKDIKSTKTN